MFRVIATLGVEREAGWTAARSVPTFYVDGWGAGDADMAARQAMGIVRAIAGPDVVSIYLTVCGHDSGTLGAAEWRADR